MESFVATLGKPSVAYTMPIIVVIGTVVGMAANALMDIYAGIESRY